MTIKAIAFDFFGVLCSEVAPIWLSRHFPAIRASRVKADLVGAADRGEIPDDILFERLAAATGLAPQQIRHEWDCLAVVDHDVVDIVRALKGGHRIGLLTNAPSGFVRHVLVENHLTDLFDSVVVSSEHRCAKPDHLIYDVLMRNLDVSASETLFIDDNPANVDGALSIGMSGIVFTGCDELCRVLSELRILT